MDPIVVDVELTPGDWDALHRHLQSRLHRRMSRGDSLLEAALGIVPAVLILYSLTLLHPRVSLLGILVGTAVIVACVVIAISRAQATARPAPDSSRLAPIRLEFDATGIRSTREYQSGFFDWRAIEAIDEAPEHVFFLLDKLLAFAVPKRNLVSLSPEVFIAQLRQWSAERRAQPEAPTSSASSAASPPHETTPRGFWSDLRSNFLVGMRVFFFRRVQPNDIVPSFDQVVGLLLVLLGVAALLDRATAGVDAELNLFGAYTWIALLLIGLWTCALVARSVSKRADTRALLVVALATTPWVILATTLLSLIPTEHSTWSVYAAIALVVWSGLRAIRVSYGTIRLPALIVIGVSLMVFAVAENSFYFDPHLWTEASDDEDDNYGALTTPEAESIFFEQQARVDEAVDKLEPQRPGVTDLYYVGFAGDGYQRVFRRETLLGQRIFGARLGTGPRSLELINDYQDRETFPLATQVSFRYALSEIGKVMDPKEDVLVLLLTSHGSREGGIYIRNGVSRADSDLPPDEVRSALDDAGIRWRIVVVSACYSGVFVEPLKTDTTMIVTAADSQHTSFGCADDRDLTYFGEAFLRDSLPKAASLADAFQQARAEIAQREKEEKLTPSNPQMWVGASMAKKLGALGRLPVGAVATSPHKSLE